MQRTGPDEVTPALSGLTRRNVLIAIAGGSPFVIAGCTTDPNTPGDDGNPGGGNDKSTVTKQRPEGCKAPAGGNCMKWGEPGYCGSYYDLPVTHPDVKQGERNTKDGPVKGLVQDELPLRPSEKAEQTGTIRRLDWFNEECMVFKRRDEPFGNNLVISEAKMEPADPQNIAVHWKAGMFTRSEDSYELLIGSSDDSWAFINGILVLDNGGTHRYHKEKTSVRLQESKFYELDIFFANRSHPELSLVFRPDKRLEVRGACPKGPELSVSECMIDGE